MTEQQTQDNGKPVPIKSPLSQYGYAVPYYGSIAKILGSTEALVLAQIDYWINYYKARNSRKHYIDNAWTVYIPIKELRDQIKDRNEKTIREAVTNLSELKVLNISHHSGGAYGRTNWYSINYDVLADIMTNNDKRIYSDWLLDYRKKKIKAGKSPERVHVEKSPESKAGKSPETEVEKSPGTITEYTTIINKHNKLNSCSFKNQEHGSREEMFNYITAGLNASDVFANTIIYFIDCYYAYGYGTHPNVSEEKLLELCDEFYNAIERNNICDEDWNVMIKDYFNQKFTGKCDHKIFHFFTPGVLDNVYHHVSVGA